MSKWQEIFASPDQQKAYMLKIRLSEQNFLPVLINKKDSCYGIGSYEIYVANEFVLPALKFISEENPYIHAE